MSSRRTDSSELSAETTENGDAQFRESDGSCNSATGLSGSKASSPPLGPPPFSTSGRVAAKSTDRQHCRNGAPRQPRQRRRPAHDRGRHGPLQRRGRHVKRRWPRRWRPVVRGRHAGPPVERRPRRQQHRGRRGRRRLQPRHLRRRRRHDHRQPRRHHRRRRLHRRRGDVRPLRGRGDRQRTGRHRRAGGGGLTLRKPGLSSKPDARIATRSGFFVDGPLPHVGQQTVASGQDARSPFTARRIRHRDCTIAQST